ncbi:MAG: hypothetical protein M0P39_16160 [Rhodocyclaceae bacterium]|jgi:hypothetical protein|nr:hypothetical protein [Rhodocyclaceae bacterium]
MTLKNRFRLVVGLSLGFAVASLVAGLMVGDISEDWKAVLEWHGNEGVFEWLLANLPESTVSRVSMLIALSLFLVFVAVVQIGMFLFRTNNRGQTTVLAAVCLRA